MDEFIDEFDFEDYRRLELVDDQFIPSTSRTTKNYIISLYGNPRKTVVVCTCIDRVVVEISYDGSYSVGLGITDYEMPIEVVDSKSSVFLGHLEMYLNCEDDFPGTKLEVFKHKLKILIHKINDRFSQLLDEPLYISSTKRAL